MFTIALPGTLGKLLPEKKRAFQHEIWICVQPLGAFSAPWSLVLLKRHLIIAMRTTYDMEPHVHVMSCPLGPGWKYNTFQWNYVLNKAYEDRCDYMYQWPDDMAYMEASGWLTSYVKGLRENGNIGLAGGWERNHHMGILSISLFSRWHLDLFGFYFDPAIHGWWAYDLNMWTYSQGYLVRPAGNMTGTWPFGVGGNYYIHYGGGKGDACEYGPARAYELVLCRHKLLRGWAEEHKDRLTQARDVLFWLESWRPAPTNPRSLGGALRGIALPRPKPPAILSERQRKEEAVRRGTSIRLA